MRLHSAGQIGLAILLNGIACACLTGAETSERLNQTLRRIYGAQELKVKPYGPVHWLENGRSYATLELSPTAKDIKEIVRCETSNVRCEVVLNSAQLTPAANGKPLVVSDFAWSSDNKRLLAFANTQKVWRQNTKGEYWIYTMEDKSWRKLGGDSAGNDLMYAKFSPDGSRVAYVRGNNIYKEDMRDGAIRPLTSDGSDTIINGASDWVYEEEFSLRDGFRWSPDGQRIAYWRFDTTGVPEFTLVNYTDALYPVLRKFPYPKAGQTNSAVRIGVVSSQGGPTRFLDIREDARNNYIPRMDWAGNSHEIILERLNRLQNTNDVLLADVDTETVRQVFRDQDAAWVETMDNFLWAGKDLIWTSERDGWNHAYAITRESAARLLTTTAADVLSVLSADSSNQWLYYISAGPKAMERYLYRVRLDGSGKSERVTPEGAMGWNTYEISPNGQFAVHTHSRFSEPPVTELIRLPEHKTVRVLHDNAELGAKAAELFAGRPDFLQVDIGGGVTLDGWMIQPRGFDPGKKYPIIVHVYGEPAGVTVTDNWSERNEFHCALADEGYIIVSFDNRGTPAPKGKAWRKVIYGSVGVLSSQEQAAALRAFAATRPYVDLSRVGVWGWSGGASNTLNLMFRSPELYQVGVAVAPVPDQRLYDTIYQERYMGLPEENAEGYRSGSPINFAEGLRGKLLIVHGTGDDNVHFQGTERLINRLIELEKPFDFMEYPNRSHAIDEGKGTELHVYTLIARYFLEHLPAGGRL